jgi:hypothetical protein
MSRHKIRWTPEEINYLQTNYKRQSPRELAAQLGRPESGVRWQLSEKLGLRITAYDYAYWTADEDQVLKSNWPADSCTLLAKKLGTKSKHAVRRRLRRLGIWQAEKPMKPWTKDEENYIMWRCEKYTIGQLAKRLGRDRTTISKYLKKMDAKPLCGVYSIGQLVRDTGYDRNQLTRARDALGMKWRVVHATRYRVSPKQKREMIEYLASEA